MAWKLVATFSQRPHVGNAIYLDHLNSYTLEYVPDAGDASVAPSPRPRVLRTDHDPYEYDHRPNHTRNPGVHPARGYMQRNQTPTGSMPTFQKPSPDDTATADQIDDADSEGYAAYLEAGVPPSEAMSPYPSGSTLDKAWKNGYARADHSDVRADDDEAL